MRTKGQFRLDANQEETDLLVSMRAVYFQYGRFMPTQIIHQVKQLNQQVIDYTLPDILTAIKQEYAYLKEINGPIKPIDRPMNVNNGKVILPSFTTTWEI